MYPDDERERVFDQIVAGKSWYWGRYSAEHRKDYLKTRLFVEDRMRELFLHKHCPPKQPCPVFFYIYPHLTRTGIDNRIQKRTNLGESDVNYVLVDLTELSDTSQISFSLCDSHTSFREAIIRNGLSDEEPNEVRKDHGTVFHIRELAEVYERHKGEDDLYFEVQVWDSEILDRWRAVHPQIDWRFSDP